MKHKIIRKMREGISVLGINCTYLGDILKINNNEPNDQIFPTTVIEKAIIEILIKHLVHLSLNRLDDSHMKNSIMMDSPPPQ